jgi:signal transduction histidine kinase
MKILQDLYKLWLRLVCIGMKENYPERLKREVSGSNFLSITTFFLLLPHVFRLYTILPQTQAGLWMFLLDSLFLIIPLLNHLRLHSRAKTAMFIISNLIVFWGCCTFGMQYGIQYAYIILVYGVILYVNYEVSFNFLVPVALPFTGTFLLYFTDFNPFMPIPLPEKDVKWFVVFNMFTYLLIAFLLSYLYARRNTRDFNAIEASRRVLQEQNRELQRLNQELDCFVYSVSHDLRSPIASVLGLISISREETDLATLQHYISLKEKSMLRLDGFIQDILHYSRNSRLEPAVQEIDLKAKVETIFDMHAYLEEAGAVRKKIILKQQMPFCGDDYRLTLILNNLIANAIHYQQADRPEPFVEVNMEVEATKMLLTVSDNGIGIEAEHLPRIFEMFYRATHQVTGSGLGLYIVREAVSRMNGSIEVTSQPGKGTTFRLELPNQMN